MNNSRSRLLALGVGILTVLALAVSVVAQSDNGWNAVVHSSSGLVLPSPSYDLVDANRFSGDLCQKINNVFTSYNSTNSNGVLVDARGVSGLALTCSSSDGNPWGNLTGANGPFSNVVLLPAGAITILSSWILPDDTRLVGEGPNLTTITAGSGFGGDIIDMGASSGFPCSSRPDCPGVIIEHLGLSGNGLGNGIVNCCAQELSHVNDVYITNVKTGLSLSDKFAENSGPYTNLTIANASVSCLSIGPGTAAIPTTRGVHGLRCSVASGSTAAITIDSPNNSLEDITISGSNSSTQDGILIGSHAAAQGNVLLNVQGANLNNVIHIKNYTPSSSSNCPGNTNNSVCDITILGVSNSGSTTTIQDDLVSATQGIKDSTVGLYVVGEPVQNIASGGTSNIGYSRFTTATASGNTPTWLVGPTTPSGSCAVGTLYSCTQCASGSGTVWECLGGGTTWKKIQ